ncbi:hypothetical protein FB451DRAFT_1408310 [Mycena latifolia]|nr:hypothetical protein FB451DRAFT_1408310 [Mycena latifolia]
MPLSDFPLDWSENDYSASVADIYLIQALNLPAASHSDTCAVPLHELENALSTIVASMFWTLGHLPPTYVSAIGVGIVRPIRTLVSHSLDDIPTPPVLLQGNATVTENSTKAHLDLSIIAVAAGLAASIALMLLSLPCSLLKHGAHDDREPPIDGTGTLHTIWLYRNHPELETLLEQVEHPTDHNLREAGMVRTRLVGGQMRKRNSFEP